MAVKPVSKRIFQMVVSPSPHANLTYANNGALRNQIMELLANESPIGFVGNTDEAGNTVFEIDVIGAVLANDHAGFERLAKIYVKLRDQVKNPQQC